MTALGAAMLWVAVTAAPARAAEPSRGPACAGEYADFLSAMSPAARALEGRAGAGSTYLLRNVATYEHVYYGTGGKLRRRLVRHVRHGTGFAYRAERGLTYLATNQHVAEHPVVTSTDEEVEGVPAGSRKVRETVRIVSDEGALDEGDQPALTLVVADEALDLAVLATPRALTVTPHRFGRSSALRVGNAVLVRGYPLGVFAAVNAGHVTSTGQVDREQAWNHEDFAVDALLNSGNSGSPVFAVSCRTGELELVGIYHAGYKDAQALNVVVAIDQLRTTLETLQRAPRPEASELADRRTLLARVRAAAQPFVMPFADRVVRVEVDGDGDTVRFGLLDGEYPLTLHSEAELIDRGQDLSRPAALVPSPRGTRREVAWAGLDAVSRGAAERLHDALWSQVAAVLEYRDAEQRRGGGGGASALAARIRAHREEQREILQSVDFDADGYARPVAGVAAAARGASGATPPDHAVGEE